MNDIDKDCWAWHGSGWKIGQTYPWIGHPYPYKVKIASLEQILKEYMTSPKLHYTNVNWVIYKVINKRIVQVLTIKEAQRIIKINKL